MEPKEHALKDMGGSTVCRYCVHLDNNDSPVLELKVPISPGMVREGEITVELSLYHITCMGEALDRLVIPIDTSIPSFKTQVMEMSEQDVHTVLYNVPYSDGTTISKAFCLAISQWIDHQIGNHKVVTWGDIFAYLRVLTRRVYDFPCNSPILE